MTRIFMKRTMSDIHSIFSTKTQNARKDFRENTKAYVIAPTLQKREREPRGNIGGNTLVDHVAYQSPLRNATNAAVSPALHNQNKKHSDFISFYNSHTMNVSYLQINGIATAICTFKVFCSFKITSQNNFLDYNKQPFKVADTVDKLE